MLLMVGLSGVPDEFERTRHKNSVCLNCYYFFPSQIERQVLR